MTGAARTTAAVALAWAALASACNDDLLGYRQARLAAADVTLLDSGAADANSPPDAARKADGSEQLTDSAGKSLDGPNDGPDAGLTDSADLGPADDGAQPADLGSDVTGVVCGGQACDDGNPCTTEECDTADKCIHPLFTGGCEDGDPCTTDDACLEGQCQAGTSGDCNDGEQCTLDKCDPKQGCLHTANGGAECDDGNGCTKLDTCNKDKCQGGQGCDANATCKKDVEVGNQCVCNAGFAGDGFACSPK